MKIYNSDEPRSIFDVKVIDSNWEEYSICLGAYGYIVVENLCARGAAPGIKNPLNLKAKRVIIECDLILRDSV